MREVAERLVQLCDTAESVQPEGLLLEASEESLDASVAYGLADEGTGDGWCASGRVTSHSQSTTIRAIERAWARGMCQR